MEGSVIPRYALPKVRGLRFSERGSRVQVPATVETARCYRGAKPISTQPLAVEESRPKGFEAMPQ